MTNEPNPSLQQIIPVHRGRTGPGCRSASIALEDLGFHVPGCQLRRFSWPPYAPYCSFTRKCRTEALKSLEKNCRQRVEYIAVPLETAPLPMPTPTPITIGGATVFTLEVEHYEEL